MEFLQNLWDGAKKTLVGIVLLGVVGVGALGCGPKYTPVNILEAKQHVNEKISITGYPSTFPFKRWSFLAMKHYGGQTCIYVDNSEIYESPRSFTLALLATRHDFTPIKEKYRPLMNEILKKARVPGYGGKELVRSITINGIVKSGNFFIGEDRIDTMLIPEMYVIDEDTFLKEKDWTTQSF